MIIFKPGDAGKLCKDLLKDILQQRELFKSLSDIEVDNKCMKILNVIYQSEYRK